MVDDQHSIARALAPGLPVTLLSPPGFALYAGAPWWLALLASASFTGFSLLDCGDAAGRALEALRIGLRGIILSAEPLIFDQIAAIARETDADLWHAAPPAFDATANSDDAELRHWLTNPELTRAGLTGAQN
ncbi:hypothetical protein ACOSOMT5_P1121 [Acidiphilium sp. MT5]